jgi:hypothetical protein
MKKGFYCRCIATLLNLQGYGPHTSLSAVHHRIFYPNPIRHVPLILIIEAIPRNFFHCIQHITHPLQLHLLSLQLQHQHKVNILLPNPIINLTTVPQITTFNQVQKLNLFSTHESSAKILTRHIHFCKVASSI